MDCERVAFCRKQSNYGPNNISLGTTLEKMEDRKMSQMGIWFRMNDKIQRLKQLVGDAVIETSNQVALSTGNTWNSLNAQLERSAQVAEERAKKIQAAADSVPGVTTKISTPVLGNVTPTLNISFDYSKIGKTGEQLRLDLRNGSPSIESVGGKDNIGMTAWSLQEGEDVIVAKRLKEVLEAAVK